MAKKRIGVIGCGQWGPNQIRTFFFHPHAEVVRICDKTRARLDANCPLYRADGCEDYTKVTRADDIDAVVVATPVSTHYEIVADALSHGKDVLCEKPLTVRAEESRKLADLAASKERILMVGHVFLYNPGIMQLKKLMQAGEIGRPFYIHAQRTNLGPVRNDVNAVYDLASHDISIFNYLLDSAAPKLLSATGKCYLQPNVEDVAFVSLEYPGGVLAHIHVSWLDPKKVRQITVVGNQKMITWNDLSPTGPVQIYSKHVEREPFYRDFGDFHLLVKEGEVLTPNVANAEPLKQQTAHFMECIVERRKPLTDALFAASVVETLETIERQLAGARSK